MEAEDEETKDWLFYHGVENDVVPAYSAWTVYEKADVERKNKVQVTGGRFLCHHCRILY